MTDLAVYIHERGKKPKKTDQTVDKSKQMPDEITIDGKTYVWVSADFISKTITYSSITSRDRSNG